MSWIVLKAPQKVTPDTPAKLAIAIDPSPTPAVFLPAETSLLTAEISSSSSTCLGIYWIRIRDFSLNFAKSFYRTKKSGFLK